MVGFSFLVFSRNKLTKFNFIGFITGPLIFVLVKALAKYPHNIRKKIIRNLGLVLCIGFIVFFPFLKFKFWEVANRFYCCSWLNSVFLSPHKSFLSFVSDWFITGADYILWSLNEISANMLSFFFFIVFVVSLIRIAKKKIEYKNMLFLWLFMLIIFSLMLTPDRFIG